MNVADIKNKILEGCKMAIRKLIDKKRRDDSYLVISDEGRVVKIKATDVATEGEVCIPSTES